MRGIAYLLERALNILPGGKLTSDPWRMIAFIAATAAILARLTPEGVAAVPSDYGPLRDTPLSKEVDPVKIGRLVGSMVFSVLESLPADVDYIAQVRNLLAVPFPAKTEAKGQ